MLITPGRRRQSPAVRFSEIETAHIRFCMRLMTTKPSRIVGNFDAIDLRDRAEYVGNVLAVVADFIDAVAADTAFEAPCGMIDLDYIDDMLRESASDVVAHMVRKADAMEDEAEARKPYALVHVMETAR
jgi:hypothetical protein